MNTSQTWIMDARAALRVPLVCALALAVGSGLTGCSSLGLAQPKSVDEQIAYAYGTYSGIENSIPVALQSGTITLAQGRAIYARAAQARLLLHAARVAEQDMPAAAPGLLAKALVILSALQALLPQHSVSAPSATKASRRAPVAPPGRQQHMRASL